MKAHENPLDKFDLIQTPFPMLNTILGGGLPSKKIVEVSGQAAVGKSTLALQLTAEYQRQKKPCLWADSEFSFTTDYAKIMGIDTHELDLVQEQFAEAMLDAIEKWATSHQNGLVVLDSIGALLPREEAEKGAEGRSIGLQARLIGSFTRRIVPILALKNNTLIVLNHTFTDLNTGRLKTSGGAKLEYAKSLWLTLKRSYGKAPKRGSDGLKSVIFIECEVRKNKTAPTEGMKADIELQQGHGFATQPIIFPVKKRGRPKLLTDTLK
jgi:recombination protein RecA